MGVCVLQSINTRNFIIIRASSVCMRVCACVCVGEYVRCDRMCLSIRFEYVMCRSMRVCANIKSVRANKRDTGVDSIYFRRKHRTQLWRDGALSEGVCAGWDWGKFIVSTHVLKSLLAIYLCLGIASFHPNSVPISCARRRSDVDLSNKPIDRQ